MKRRDEEILAKDYIIAFQKMVLGISSKFLNINEKNYDEYIIDTLTLVGDFFNVDRVYMFTINRNHQTMTCNHQWCSQDVEEKLYSTEDIDIDIFSWWKNEIYTKDIVYIEDVTKMEAKAKIEQSRLQKRSVKSVISLPVKVNNQVVAFIGIESIKHLKVWSKKHINLLLIITDVLAGAINKINQDRVIGYLAYKDLLTGLGNESSLMKHLGKSIFYANKKNLKVGLLIIDIDDFKLINDTLGHYQGDLLIRQTAERISSILTPNQKLFRRGGDEFILCFYGSNKDSLNSLAKSIIDLFTKPFILKNENYHISSTIGLAQYPVCAKGVPSLIEHAAMAMYQAKKAGKNTYKSFANHFKENTRKELVLINDLNGAVDRNEMTLYYQPKVDTFTEEITGVEALIRWNHPKQGLISPFDFIGLAEKSGHIYKIGKWVLETACNQAKMWQTKGFLPVKVSVNFSPYQLSQNNIVEKVLEILTRTGLSPSNLEIEITESLIAGDVVKVNKSIEGLSKLGITISIDDYGVECSSLSRIKDMPINKVKIDRTFINGINKSIKDEVIIKNLILLCSELGFKIVAEGVEKEHQLEFLRRHKCDEIQGYYFFKPLTITEVEKVLKLS